MAKCDSSTESCAYFYRANVFGQFQLCPPKFFLSCAYDSMWVLKGRCKCTPSFVTSYILLCILYNWPSKKYDWDSSLDD